VGLADAGAVRQDQVALEGGGVGGGDLDAGELAEAGVDAVDGGVARDGGGDAGRGGLDRGAGARSSATGPVPRQMVSSWARVVAPGVRVTVMAGLRRCGTAAG
jgi:hypothetical protein